MNRKYMGRHQNGRNIASQPGPASLPNLTTIQQVPKTRLVPGAVVWAHVPYEGDGGEKTRPAVVKELRGRHLTLLPATTSQSRHRFPGIYVELDDLASAGLSRATAIRTIPVIVDIIEVIDIVGALGETDAARTLGHLPEVA